VRQLPTIVANAGFEGFLDLNRRVRRTPVKAEDRFFSSSSVTGTRHLPPPDVAATM
jgi:hypothetical protein